MPRGHVKQSNKPEHCPICTRRLANRMAAHSHYKAHARRGELDQRGEAGTRDQSTLEWRIVGQGENSWWRKGFSYYDSPGTTVEQGRVKYVEKLRHK